MTQTEPGALVRLRAANRRSVLRALAQDGACSRADLARRTGLSPTTISSLVRDLLSDGLLTQRPDCGTPHKGGSGRPPRMVALSMPAGGVAGIDIGHRHVRVAIADRTGTVLHEEERKIDADERGPRTLDVAVDLLDQSVASVDGFTLVGVGLCVPAPIDRRSARISTDIMPGWRGVVPVEDLASRINVPVMADNDANLGALAELHRGAGRGAHDFIYLKLASGLGAGLVIGRQVYKGSTGHAGEIGHVRVREHGAVCRCGNRGCLETEVSVPRLIELLQPAYDIALKPATVEQLERDGDPGVRRVLEEAGGAVGRVLADLCNTLNPSLVIIGGPFGRSAAIHRGLQAALDRYAQPDIAQAVDIVSGELGIEAQVRGAIDLAVAGVAHLRDAQL
ncbi:ROK family transcriptional regulator [Luteipulveratus mongoliensis]|uniref:ROK family transcriptional regulator n=1 Tax=Luteipulveratus mongoliensis TaxID=571913 RepID=A0A0K1JD96_9MICO|nr:ROK family transcriptional regulator [Luteipulveratus mongoliensis]AKU14674.1 ROK family transcriptional regulator [Luteipulveratus mongoliensis]